MDRNAGRRDARLAGGRFYGVTPVALAIRNADMQGNRIFDLPPDGPVDQAPYTPWRLVRDFGAAAGFELMTADQVAIQGIDPRQVTVISYDWPPATDTLVAQGAHLAVLTSLEPPVIAWELYYKLPKLSRSFPHVYLFGGAASRVASTTQFHPLQFPQVRVLQERHEEDWQQRRFLVSINSNKAMVRSFTRWFDRPREVSVKREIASRLYPPIGRDLYLERLRAAAHFAKRPDFDMVGQGWQRRHPAVPPELHAAVLPAYRGPVPEKLAGPRGLQVFVVFRKQSFSRLCLREDLRLLLHPHDPDLPGRARHRPLCALVKPSST